MNELSIIKKRILIVCLAALVAVAAFALVLKFKWGGVSVENTKSIAVNISETKTLDSIIKEAKYSPSWIKSDKITVSINLKTEDEEDCIIKYDEKTRTFTACGVGTGEIVVSDKTLESVNFVIPFSIKFFSDKTLSLIPEEAKDGMVTEKELQGVKKIHIKDKKADAIDFKYFPNLEGVIIESNELEFTNLASISQNVHFYVPQLEYSKYMQNASWGNLAERTYPNVDEDNCVVVFDLEGGKFDDSKLEEVNGSHFDSVKLGEKVDLEKHKLNRVGYTFVEWQIEPNGSKANADDLIKSDTKLLAKWKENEYKIVYDLNGTGITPTSVPETAVKYSEETTIYSGELKRTGYTFGGWSTVSNSTTPTYRGGEKVSKLRSQANEEYKLYAIWTANEYAIYYYELNNTSYQQSQSILYDQEIVIKNATSTKQGYNFVGWSTSASSNEIKYQSGQSIKNLTSENDSGISLYAVWSPISYTITYVSAGGVDGVPSDQTALYDQQVSIPNITPQKVGHIFLGWSRTEAHSTKSYDSLPANSYRMGELVSNLADKEGSVVKMYPVWKADGFTVILDPNGGSGRSTNLAATYGSSIRIETESYKRDKYELLGWALTNYATEAKFDSDSLSSSDIAVLYGKVNTSKQVTIYAVWSPIYKIQYNANGGETTPSEQSATVGVKVKLADAIKKKGYTFDGWKGPDDTYDAGERVQDLAKTAGAVVTLTAQWKPIKYTIKYDTDGATSTTPSSISLKYEESGSLAVAPTKDGYTFKGWEYNGVTYYAGAIVKNLTDTSTTITMKAIWEKK